MNTNIFVKKNLYFQKTIDKGDIYIFLKLINILPN